MFTLRFAFIVISTVAALLALSRHHLGIGLFGLSLVPLFAYFFRSSKKMPTTRVARTMILLTCLVPLYVALIGPLFAVLYFCYAYQVRPAWVDRLPTQIYAPLLWLPEESPLNRLLEQYVISWEETARPFALKYRDPPNGWHEWGEPH